MRFKDVFFEPIDDRCYGCEHVKFSTWAFGIDKCKVYWRPKSWWNRGACPLATHLEPVVETPLDAQRRRIGQQKQRRKW